MLSTSAGTENKTPLSVVAHYRNFIAPKNLSMYSILNRDAEADNERGGGGGGGGLDKKKIELQPLKKGFFVTRTVL